jgi:hypothetical protein
MSDFIPAARALIGWNTNSTGEIVAVFVLDQGEAPDPYYLGPAEWQQASYTHGACFRDWLKQHDMTPEFVFSEMLVAYRFANSAVAENAIAAFARIECCDWARKMVPTSRMRQPSWKADSARLTATT